MQNFRRRTSKSIALRRDDLPYCNPRLVNAVAVAGMIPACRLPLAAVSVKPPTAMDRKRLAPAERHLALVGADQLGLLNEIGLGRLQHIEG
jgi:hypothetical protein